MYVDIYIYMYRYIHIFGYDYQSINKDLYDPYIHCKDFHSGMDHNICVVRRVCTSGGLVLNTVQIQLDIDQTSVVLVATWTYFTA